MYKEYPTEEELEKIRNWKFKSNQDWLDLIDYINDVWIHGYGKYRLTGKRVKKLYLATGGWSGNEDIIGALYKNFIFWSICWKMSQAGGAYWFEIRPLKEK